MNQEFEYIPDGDDEEGSLERLIIPNQKPSFDMDEMMKSIERVMVERGVKEE